MSLHDAAQHLAAQGRGPDDQLIHMSSNEIAGLQALAKSAGGSLTINPETGLAEAGFLDNLLPTIIGAGAMYLSGGAINPATIGMGVGALQTARTGDLGKGLMAGLGAAGGAGMLGNLAGVGESMVGADMALGDKLGAGFDAFKAAPEASMLGGGKMIGMAAAPAVMDMLQPKAGSSAPGTPQMIRPYTFAANKQTPENMVGSEYQPGQDTSERQWFQPSYTALQPYRAAQGGLADLTRIVTGEDVMPSERREEQRMAMGGPTNNEFDFAGSGGGSVIRMADGGLSTLGDYAAGGSPRLLKGPGDGMSDNIPATIGTKQPARLADGEFVVPADVVSHLGNGSTDAGAKQLYKMMDRIRQQRTGKKKQAPEVNPKRAMPA